MATLTQGTYTKNNIVVEVLGTPENGYRYKWLRQLVETETKVDYSQFLPILIVDYSASMNDSNSARPATDATKSISKSLLEKGFPEVLLIFFGKTAYAFTVNLDTLNSKVDAVLKDYFEKLRWFCTNGKFNPEATVPTTAFTEALKYLNEHKNYTNAFITFMTDGQFNVHQSGFYLAAWNALSDKFKSSGKEVTISCVGYQNDSLNNIKQLKDSFDTQSIRMSYTTIKNPSEIQNAMEESFEQFDLNTVPKLQLSDTLMLTQDDCVYSYQQFFEKLEPIDVLTNATKNTGVSAEWITKVILFEIEIGMKETGVMDTLNNASKLGSISKQKEMYKTMVVSMVPFFSYVQKKYMELKSAYKSLKTRDIYAWRSLYERITSIGKLLRDVQTLVSDELNEKKAFEVATKISNSVTARHMRTLQRRKIGNELNKNIKKVLISVKQEEFPLTVSCMFQDSGKELMETLDSKLTQLNEYYSCTYSMEEWDDMLNTCLGISMQYKWKEGDDWAPARSFIENVSTSAFVSIDGYNEMQTFFGGAAQIPEHEKLYGTKQYVLSAHDKGNAFIPVAVDPFFIQKLPLVKERLGHMISGSSLTFRNAHVLFYVAVMKQCFNQLIENNTEKMRHIILLLLNTFKILTDKLNTVFDKENTPVNKSDILYNIAIGNTAPYLFGGSWESAFFALVGSEQQYQKALEKYNTLVKNEQVEHVKNEQLHVTLVKNEQVEHGSVKNEQLHVPEKATTLATEEFKKQVWEMVLRHWLIVAFDKRDIWEMPTTWGLLDQKEIEAKLKAEGPESLTKYLMNENKVLTVPTKIQDELVKLRDWKLIKLFKLLISWADKLNDGVWNTFNKSFMPYDFKEESTTLTNHFTNELIDTSCYWTYWECYAYGQKECCFPVRTHNEISKVVANNINSKYGENLTGVLADVKELLDFKKRNYETRFLPVTFTPTQQTQVNDLFTKVYAKQLGVDEFKAIMKCIIGEYYASEIDQVLANDSLDVLKNLFIYCQSRKHSIWIKSESRLPKGCPANTSSPYFLQSMTDTEFSMYFKPLGFGWSTKKYTCWISDLHPYMTSRMNSAINESDFVNNVMGHIGTFRFTGELNKDRFENEIRHFYNQFRGLAN